jgi:hypothetical protein
MAGTGAPVRHAVNVAAIGVLLLCAATTSASALVPTSGVYHVSGNRILDPSGHRFIVNGVDAVYGRFAGGDPNGYGLHNYQNAPRDLDNLRAQGVNTVRVSVAYADYTGGPLGSAEYLNELDQVVSWVTQRGMVAEISQGESGFSSDVVNFVGLLAGRYQGNPAVWIKPDNEPNCHPYSSSCGDWAYWQSTEQQFVQAIRGAGNTQPIVVNCVWWSWDCSQIGSYPLGDSNIIYGAHRYGNGNLTFDPAQTTSCDMLWGNLSSAYALIVDEVGLYDGMSSPAAWGAGFLDYATIWVHTRQGNGVIGFNDSWSDGNSMTNYGDGSWNSWGQAFITHYLSQ